MYSFDECSASGVLMRKVRIFEFLCPKKHSKIHTGSVRKPPVSLLSLKISFHTDALLTENLFPTLLKIGEADAMSLAEIKLRRTCCTLSIYFGVATTQMRRIFSKVYTLNLDTS